METLIIDITKAYAGSEATVVQQSKNTFAGPEATAIVVRRENQPSFQVTATEEVLLPNPVHYSTVASAVGAKLFAALERSADGTVTVVTGHRAVFDLEAAVAVKDRTRVRFRPFSALRPYEQKAAEFTWPADLMPLDDAVAMLAEALRRGGARTREAAVRKSLVRPFLETVDDRFRKPHPLAALPGVVSFLVSEARKRGRIAVSEEQHNPTIWLLDSGGPAKTTQVTLPVRRTRSQQFIDVLAESRLGPFASIRLQLYSKMALLLNNAPKPLTVGELISHTIEQTRQEVVSRGDGRIYPWRRVREFLITLLGRRPVLISEDGTLLAPTFRSLTTRVSALIENWDVELEGELITALVQANVEIALADTPLLAGALYYSREEDDEARAEQVIAHLLRTGRLTESTAPPYRLMLTTTAPTLNVVHTAVQNA